MSNDFWRLYAHEFLPKGSKIVRAYRIPKTIVELRCFSPKKSHWLVIEYLYQDKEHRTRISIK